MSSTVSDTIGWAVAARFLMAGAFATLTACGGGGNGAGAPEASLALAANAVKADVFGGPGLIAQSPGLVNTTTEGNQVLHTIGALDDGGYMVVWRSQTPIDGSLGQWYLQRFDALGAKAGGETLIPLEPGGVSRVPGVAVLGDGSVVVAYVSARLVSPTEPWMVQQGVHTRRFDASGIAIGGETLVSSFLHNTLYARESFIFTSPAIVAGEEGGYLVGWSLTQDSLYGPTSTLGMQRFDSGGLPVGTPLSFPNAGIGSNWAFRLMATPGSGYVIAITDLVMGEVYVRFNLVDSTGQLTGTIGAAADPTQRLPDRQTVLLARVDGRYALWSRDAGGAYFQLFGASGAPQGTATPVSSVPVAAAALGDGGYVVFWATAAFGELLAQRFDSVGVAVGEPVSIQASGWPASAVPLLGGDVVIAWTTPSSPEDLDVAAVWLVAPALPEGRKDRQRTCLAEAKALVGAEHRGFMKECMNGVR